MPILTCIFFTFNWLTLTSEMHFVRFYPEVASCLLSRGKRKYMHPWGEAIMKIHKKLFSGIPFNFTLFVISPKLQRIWSWNFRYAIRKIRAFIWNQKYTTSGSTLGDENVIGVSAFNEIYWFRLQHYIEISLTGTDRVLSRSYRLWCNSQKQVNNQYDVTIYCDVKDDQFLSPWSSWDWLGCPKLDDPVLCPCSS